MGDEQQGQAAGLVTADDAGATLAAQVEELRRELLEARQAALVSRDHVVGIEAEVGRQNADILRLTTELRRESARAKRLAQRKQAQAKRITELQDRLATARKRNAALTRRVGELEAARPSLARRVARRLRGPRR
ncbi:hypothetical protein SAMN04489844_0117 [Nocardioides exalbidus]|uniref:Uncharacterized protein n=1 Tax=Nocardioides exalbidus TaxID=402596 RepID=A0A1H4JFE9_9ACTN|nr:hypothetical protein [Nocardioides exalbidus]SEB45023.1 hypothetical protein SAMN04489844_0117 [Nocardioides exalbidus]